jgi:hypothetical protein
MDDIIKVCDDLVYEERMDVLGYLVKHDCHIVEGADGCRVNLDRLEPEVLNGLKELVEELRNKPIPLEYKI